MRTLIPFVACVALLSATEVAARVPPPITKEQCLAEFARQGVDPKAIQPGETYFGIDVFSGMYPEYICKKVAQQSLERWQNATERERLNAEIKHLTALGKTNAGKVDKYEHDWVYTGARFSWMLNAILIACILGFACFVFFWKRMMRILGFFRKTWKALTTPRHPIPWRKRFGRSSGRKLSHDPVEYEAIKEELKRTAQ